MQKVTLIIADYAPVTDTIKAFTYGFKKHDGKTGEVIKARLGTNDFFHPNVHDQGHQLQAAS